MNNKRAIILLVLSIIIVVFATARITFAFFSVSDVQTNNNTLSTGCYSLSFTEGSSSINVTSYPMSNTKGLSQPPYKFTIKNNCASNTNYQIILNLKNTTNTEILPYINYSFDGTNVNILSSATKITLPSGVTSSGTIASYLLDTGSISGTTASKTYNLRIWLGEEAGNNIMKLKFEAEIMAYAVASNTPNNTLKRTTLTNLVTDASFETGNWNGTLDTAHVKYGHKALKITGSSSTEEVTISNKTAIPIDSTHKYYARYEVYHTGASGSAGIYWPITEPSFVEGQSLGAANSWNIVGSVNTRSSFASNNYQMRVDYNNSYATTTVWYDGMMIIDLTASFGSGKEPNLAWCNANIPFFEGTKGLYYISTS